MARNVVETVGVDIDVQTKGGSVRTLTRVEQHLIQLVRQAQSAAASLDRMGRASGRAAGGARRASEATQALGQGTALLSSRLGRVISLFGRLGPVALALGAALYIAVKAFQALAAAMSAVSQPGVAFERSIKEIMTISERSEFSVSKIIDLTTGLARDFGTELGRGTKALYQAISAGATTAAKATAALAAAAQLSVGGLTDMASAVDVVTGSVNAYSLEGLTAQEVTDSMFQTIRYGVTNGEQLAANLGNVSTFAASAGVSFQELNAALATLTKRGVRTQKATIQLRQIMAQISKPTAEAKEEAKRLGIEFDSLAVREQGLLGFLRGITESANYTAASFSKMFGNSRSLNAVLGLMLDGGKEFSEQLGYQADALGAGARAADIMRDSTANLIDRMSALKESIIATFALNISENEGIKRLLRELIKLMDNVLTVVKSPNFREAMHSWMAAIATFYSYSIEALLLLRRAFHHFTLYIFEDGERIKADLFNLWQDYKEGSNKRLRRHGLGGNQWTVEPKMDVPRGNVEQGLIRLQKILDDFSNSPTAPTVKINMEAEANTQGFRVVTPEMEILAALIASQKAAREEEKRAEARAKAAREEAQLQRQMDAAMRRLARTWAYIVQKQERGVELWERMNRNADKAAGKRSLDTMVTGAKSSGDVGKMQDTLARLMEMKRDVDQGLENLRTGAVMAKADLLAATTKEDTDNALQELEDFTKRYADLVREMNDIDQARDTLQAAIAETQKERQRRQEKEQRRHAKEMARMAGIVIGSVSGMAQDLIQLGGQTKEVTKAIAKRFVQMTGDIISAMIRQAAVKKATAAASIAADSAKAGGAVGADAAGKFGIAAVAIAPPLIAAMVGIITSLLDTFHDGGIMAGGRRIPLNMGPSERLAVLRDGEAVIPTAKMKSGSGGQDAAPTAIVSLSYLSDPSRARFTRHMDEDVVPALERSLNAGRTTLGKSGRVFGRRK